MAFPMLVLLALITLIVSFGVGFILNMMTKYWLTSGIVGLALFAFVLLKSTHALGVFIWALLALLLIGSFASGFAIRTLRNRGFRMFQ